MVRKSSYLFYALLLCCVFLMHTGGEVQAAEDDEVKSLIEGFEEDTATAEEPSLEDMMSGFDSDETESQNGTPSDEKKSPVTLDGYFKVGASWNIAHDEPETGETDWRGLSKLRSEIQADVTTQLHKNWKLLVSGKLFFDAAYGIRGRDEFTDEVIDEYEWEAEWREVYLQGRLGSHLDLKAGRQIVVWGRSDNLRITDVLNPLDRREPGLTDIEDLRLPTAMSRLDGYWGQWNLTGIAIHEIRFNKNPVFGSDFFPATMPLPSEETPSDTFDNTEWALALNGIFSGKDISFYWANLFDENAHTVLSPGSGLIRQHARVSMWGAAGNLALGNWLLIGEAAYWTGLKFFNNADQRYQRLDALVGIEYSGFDDTTLTLEWAVRHIHDFEEGLKSAPDFAQEDEIINAVRLTRTFWNETLESTLLALVYGPLGQDGSLMRLTLDYDWSDSVSIKIGAVFYQSGDRFTFREIGDNDRLFLEIKYSY